MFFSISLVFFWGKNQQGHFSLHQEKISSDSPFWKAKFNIRSVNAPPRRTWEFGAGGGGLGLRCLLKSHFFWSSLEERGGVKNQKEMWGVKKKKWVKCGHGQKPGTQMNIPKAFWKDYSRMATIPKKPVEETEHRCTNKQTTYRKNHLQKPGKQTITNKRIRKTERRTQSQKIKEDLYQYSPTTIGLFIGFQKQPRCLGSFGRDDK